MKRFRRRRAVITRLVPPEVPYTGRIVIADNFRDGAPVWEAHPNYPDTEIWWQGIYVLSGWRSLCVKDGSASPSAGTVAMARRRAPAVVGGDVAVQLSFLFPSASAASYLYFAVLNIAHYDERIVKQLALRYDVANSRWEYLDSSLSYQALEGGDQQLDEGIWHKLILKLNFGPPQFRLPAYVELSCDGKEIDMSGLNGYAEVVASDVPRFEVQIGCQNAADGSAASVYIDDLIVVEGEL